MRRIRVGAAVAAIVIGVACADSGTVEPIRVDEPSQLSRDEQMAWAVAQVLGQRQHSELLRDELRASPYTRHRVHLQEFLGAGKAAALVADLAAALSREPGEFLAEIRSLPPLDIWLPSRDHRMTWSGTPSVVVVARLKRSPAKRGFRSDGGEMSRTLLESAEMESAGALPLVMIAPSEGLAIRSRPQKRTAGPVVQDPDDGELGGMSIKYLADGDSVVVQLASSMQAAVDRWTAGRDVSAAAGPGDPVPSVVAANKTYLKGLFIIRGEDFNNPTNPLELRWQAKLRRRSDNQVMLSQNTNMDMPNEYMGLFDLVLLDAVQSSGSYVWLKLLEDDGGWGQDDYGEYVLTDESANYLNKSWAEPYFGGGGGRCGAQTINGTFACPHYTSYGVFFWAEVSFNLQWNPWSPPSNPQLATVVGPAMIMPYEWYTWTAGNLNGQAPFSFEWYLDGNLVGTDATLEATIGDPSSSHGLVVEIHDASGYWHSAMLSVNVSSGQCQPNEPNCAEYLRASPVPRLGPARPKR